jgi:hypothetical protein
MESKYPSFRKRWSQNIHLLEKDGVKNVPMFCSTFSKSGFLKVEGKN